LTVHSAPGGGEPSSRANLSANAKPDPRVFPSPPLATPVERLFLGDPSAGSQRSVMTKNLYVGNLSYKTTTEELREAFARFGTVTRAQVVEDRETGRSRGFGFVEMADGAEEAVSQMNGAMLGGRTLTVNEARPREPRR
jgi:RNA recognition motif-containing protein